MSRRASNGDGENHESPRKGLQGCAGTGATEKPCKKRKERQRIAEKRREEKRRYEKISEDTIREEKRR